MPGKLVHFELPADDPERAREFWSGVFGWSFADSGMPDIDYWMTQTSDEQGGAIYPKQGNEHGPIVYFDTDDIESTIADIRARGGRADDRQPIPHVGWFARCSDTEGNDFSLFQSDEDASMPAPENA